MSTEEVNAKIVKHFFQWLAGTSIKKEKKNPLKKLLEETTTSISLLVLLPAMVPVVFICLQYRSVWLLCLAA